MNDHANKSPDGQGREPAWEAGSLGELLRTFYEQGRVEKQRVISAFREKSDSLIFPVLEQALRESRNANRRNAGMEVYCALGERSVPPLLALLRDEDEEVRTFSCVMLGTIGSRLAVPDLIRSLADPDLNVKHAAAEALGRIKDPLAVDPLVGALASDLWLQFPAAAALGEIGDARAVPPLIALLKEPGANVPAIQSLGKIGAAAAIEPLCAFLEDEEPSLREWALEAIAKLLSRNPNHRPAAILSGKARDLLINSLGSDSLKTRRSAMVVHGYFRVEQASALIAGFLSDRETREDAIEALIRIGGESALPRLDSCLRDADPLVRRAAVQILAGLGTKRALDAILPLASDPDADVRAEAMLSIERIGSAESRKAFAPLVERVSGANREAGKKLLDAYTAIGEAGGPARGFSRDDVLPLRDYISEKMGLFYNDERLHVLHHRLDSLAASRGFRSLAELHRHLIADPTRGETLQKLAEVLTNHETYFFREMEQLHDFMASALPELVRKKLAEGRPRLRVLSAGCSSGEEAYTLALLLEEAGVRAKGCRVDVQGIDVDRRVVETARSGRYPDRSFRKGESPLVKKYFLCADGECTVTDRIRDLVTFSQGNLMECADPGSFDVIFCRNVLIYFTDRSIERVANNFHRMLEPGGYLLLGHSESLCRVETDFEAVRLDRTVVYRKR